MTTSATQTTDGHATQCTVGLDGHTPIQDELYDTLTSAAEALHVLCANLMYSPMERDYLVDTRNRLNLILLSPRKEAP